MARIPLFSPDSMTPEQELVYRAVVGGPRGALVGPLRAALHRPELADRWQRFGEILRYGTTLPARMTELAIMVTARRWNSQLEWHIHAEAALRAGLDSNVVRAIQAGISPSFCDPEEADVYEFARQLQQEGNVEENVYQRIMARWGSVGAVELGAVVGYYTLVSMTLNVHDIPLPDGVEEPLRSLRDSTAAGASLPTLPCAIAVMDQ
ncbi:4-carboxymuconolactone decarboxylase [Paraburkholderia sp. BL27I4N3]|uniref:carboxymuconolactone decarboxylase family protein n=1 Tax=Paraburkholderia sp. BL27I4N3 TaxID=1938805 RepID=UPI000E242C5B|nr:carboxymuconolactone decarboxylase family protein [Paraburkholderia sp. BL27I4N3]REE07438.1 4-carboxymuconolactone decarboxylase [Paraburkholderia sp. BL27I4N3]